MCLTASPSLSLSLPDSFELTYSWTHKLILGHARYDGYLHEVAILIAAHGILNQKTFLSKVWLHHGLPQNQRIVAPKVKHVGQGVCILQVVFLETISSESCLAVIISFEAHLTQTEHHFFDVLRVAMQQCRLLLGHVNLMLRQRPLARCSSTHRDGALEETL